MSGSIFSSVRNKTATLFSIDAYYMRHISVDALIYVPIGKSLSLFRTLDKMLPLIFG